MKRGGGLAGAKWSGLANHGTFCHTEVSHAEQKIFGFVAAARSRCGLPRSVAGVSLVAARLESEACV
jgi:hypothetical protein